MTITCTLVSGIRVANFSSPHPFIFDDGTVLSAVDADTANTLKLESVEIETPHATLVGITDINLSFNMSDVVLSALLAIATDITIDICLVPFPVMNAIKTAGLDVGKFRVCRVADRITKMLFSDKFCK